MPIELRVNHLDRMVTGIAHGDVTSQQLDRAVIELAEAALLHYKKLVDVSAAFSHITSDDVAVFASRFIDEPKVIRGGPLAIVADPKRDEMAQLFAELIGKDRPTRIFHSIHEARKWLYAIS
jgi:hypothetical protein